MGQGAVALLRIDIDAIPKEWQPRAALRGDCVLLHTLWSWRAFTADQHAYLLREDLGSAFAEHHDRRGVLVFSDAYEVSAYGYAKLVRELKGDWGSAARCDHEATAAIGELGLDDAWFRTHARSRPPDLERMLETVARQIASKVGGDVDVWRAVVEAQVSARMAGGEEKPRERVKKTPDKTTARTVTSGRAPLSGPDLRLEAVLGVTKEAALAGLRHELARTGWTAGKAGPGDDARTIRLITSTSGVAIDDDRDGTRGAFDGFRLSPGGRWVSMTSADDPDAQFWSKRLSSRLDVTGVSMRLHAEFGEVEILRFDGGQERGAFRLRSGRPKGEVAQLAFLADLPDSPKGRAALRKGLPIDRARVASTLRVVAAMIGAPEPVASSAAHEGAVRLVLRRPSVSRFRAPRPALHQIRFRECLHVAGVGVHDVMALVGKALSEKGRGPAGDRPIVRRAFFHVDGPWVSFAELLVKDTLAVRWPKVIARVLGVPVLLVRAGDARVDLELWSGTADPLCRTLPDDLDLGWLDALAVTGLKAKPASLKKGNGDPQAMLAEVGARLGLRAPVLEGELEGYFLDFGVVTGKT